MLAAAQAHTPRETLNPPVHGQPLHTRSLTLHLTQREDGRMRAFGNVIDLRKRGFVPMMGDLQPAGVIHHMVIDAVIDPGSRVLEQLDVAQPVVAIEPAPATQGESCRDSAPALQTLVGHRIDPAFGRALTETYGGPRGCSHLYTLFQMMAAALPRALDFEAEQLAQTDAQRRPDETIFRRTIMLDGLEQPGPKLQMLVQLADVANRPEALVDRPLDRLAWQHELRAVLTHSTRSFEIIEVGAHERRRDAETLGSAPWRDRGDDVAFLIDEPIMPGLGGRLLRAFAERDDAHHLMHAFLQFAPGFIQCTAAFSGSFYERGQKMSKGTKDAMQMGGGTDSCHMWRRESPLLQIRTQQLRRG